MQKCVMWRPVRPTWEGGEEHWEESEERTREVQLKRIDRETVTEPVSQARLIDW